MRLKIHIICVMRTTAIPCLYIIYRDSVTSLGEFKRYVDSADNNQKIEIEKIQQFVLTELERQNKMANATKVTCEKKLLHLQILLEDTKQQMKVVNQVMRCLI